jgi:glycosyltransferase involved in cell wall biosynthesis
VDDSIAIITVVKDDPVGLISTYESLVNQTHMNWTQTIVVAQNSVSTMDVGLSIARSDSRVQAIWQKSKGIYPAMNEALELIDSPFCWFMNSGDTFYDNGIIERAFSIIVSKGTGLIIGGYAVKNASSVKEFKFRPKSISKSEFALNRRSGCHQAMLFKTSTLKEIGCYDSDFPICADFKSIIDVIGKHGAFRDDKIYACVKPGGISDTQLKKVYFEKHQIRQEAFSSRRMRILSRIWTALARLKHKFKSMKSGFEGD